VKETLEILKFKGMPDSLIQMLIFLGSCNIPTETINSKENAYRLIRRVVIGNFKDMDILQRE